MPLADPTAATALFVPASSPLAFARDLPQVSARLRENWLIWIVLSAALFVGAAKVLSPDVWLHQSFALLGSILFAAALLLAVSNIRRTTRSRIAQDAAAAMMAQDPSDCCLADRNGRILVRTPSMGGEGGEPRSVAAALAPLLADAGMFVRDLQSQAARTGGAESEAPARGGAIRVTVRHIDEDTFFWRRQIVESNSGGARLPNIGGAASPVGPAWDAIEELPLPLLRMSPSGVILTANRLARALLPMSIGQDSRLSDLLEGLGRPMIEWIADVAEGRPATGAQFLRGTGEHHDTILRVTLSLAGPEGDRHLIAVLDDVTELKALEAQFVQSQKMQALGQLAGGVAHDFNNLLTAISGHCDLLLLRHDQGDPEFADLIQIRQNVNRAASLVGQLLAFSRKQSMMPETIDLRVALSDLTHLLNRLVGERVRLALHHDPAGLYIRADKRQLEQVVMNLVVNARDAMPNGGEIRIETSRRRLAQPLTLGRATVPPGRYVLVTVTDEGMGIPAERLPKIFEPFYTTKKPGEGTGLGLSTAYGIIKQSGGFIFADSDVGQGSTFSLWFPAHDKPRAKSAPVVRAPAVARNTGGVILLVEDEAPVRAFAARALRLRGYVVLEAECGEAALAQLADTAVVVDLILTDVILPDMDGPTWVRKALETRPGLKVIFASGYAEEAFTEQKALIAGSIFLPKPFSLVELTSVVERQLSEECPPEAQKASQPIPID